MSRAAPSLRDPTLDLVEINRAFYDPLWSRARLIPPERFNTWPLVRELTAPGQARLEVAPGLRPRLPLTGTQFADGSAPAVSKLAAAGARATVARLPRLPFADASFDLVCALDVVEHVEDDRAALAELARVARPGATLLLSVPLHPDRWTGFDDLVGHRRRYAPAALPPLLAGLGFEVQRSAGYGMQLQPSPLLDLGLWFLRRRRRIAMRWYSHVFMPLGLRLQKPLAFSPGMIAGHDAGDVLLVCRRSATTSLC